MVGCSPSVRPGFRNLGEGFPGNQLGDALFCQVYLSQVTTERQSSQEKGTEMSPVVKLRHPLGSPWIQSEVEHPKLTGRFCLVREIGGALGTMDGL